jgi:hypothetical protein
MIEDQRDGNGSLAAKEYMLASVLNNMRSLFSLAFTFLVEGIYVACKRDYLRT